MAEMLVDSTKLDACLDAEADAIRAKTGGSADIPFDFANNKGFADAIAAIPTGGGVATAEITLVQDYSFANATSINIMNMAATAVGKPNYAVALKERDASKSSKDTFVYGVNITDQGIPSGAGFMFRNYARANGTGGYITGTVGGTGCSAWSGDVFIVWGWD